MGTLRNYLCWTYGFISLVSMRFAVTLLLKAIHGLTVLPNLRVLMLATLLVVFSGIFGATWWTILRNKAAERVLGICSSLTCILVAAWPLMNGSRLHWENQGVMFAVGIVGLFASWQRTGHHINNALDHGSRSIPGDGTHELFNKVAGIAIFGISLVAYLWWMVWLKTTNTLALHNVPFRLASTLLLILVITAVHEFGHAAVGLACGMKLRSFFIGPLQWRIRDGRWEFRFSPKGILLPDGVTSLVPASGVLPRWHFISMMLAGSLANAFTGVIALKVALISPTNSAVQSGGILALFGAWSVALSVGNLLPFKIKNGYSDGAIIVQYCSRGLLADLQLVMAEIGSSLISSLRPRDYDISRLRRTSLGIEHGKQGMLLRLHAFSHFVDCGRMREADVALEAAETIYHQSASNIPAELHSVFVFGSAFVRHDAVAARLWWERMQAKKPTKMNAAYWRAASALHLIEGDLKAARVAWEDSMALAQELPEAGAYEFERHCCRLLRRALDEAVAEKARPAEWKAEPSLELVHARNA
jgi:Peptidase family M50